MKSIAAAFGVAEYKCAMFDLAQLHIRELLGKLPDADLIEIRVIQFNDREEAK